MDLSNTTKWRILKYDSSGHWEKDDDIAAEYTLTLKLDGEEFATMVCSPSHLHELVIGFLASEGVIRAAGQVKSLRIEEDAGFAYVEATPAPGRRRRRRAGPARSPSTGQPA